jgi:hypothetical protein
MFIQPSQIPNLQITPHNNTMKTDTQRLRDRDKERGELVERRILSFVCILRRFFLFRFLSAGFVEGAFIVMERT